VQNQPMNEPKPEPCELAEQVFEKPLSGAFEEVLFGSDRGNILWVKFSDKDGINEWIGKFEVGGSGAGYVTKYEEPDKFVVSAGGFAYLVDATNRRLMSQYHNDNALEIIFDCKRKSLIVADNTDLHWIEFGGKTSFSRQISVDGICGLKIEGEILSGLAYRNYDNEQRFWFDLDTLKILRWEEIISKTPAEKKIWWKFW
jgi:hypothetical protein